MGDSRRNKLFATFIVKQFSKVKTVLVIADGKGELARKLANKGLQVRVIENKPRFEGRGHNGITYRKGWFDRNCVFDEDLIVGMHPDEATAEILLAGEKNRKSWAIVPCCVKGTEAKNIDGYRNWMRKLKQLCRNACQEYTLKISGKNIVLFRKFF